MKKQVEWLLFALLSAAALGSFFYESRVLAFVLLGASILYLAMGWYLFNPAMTRNFDPVYFLLGYAVSSSFMAFFLKALSYPLEKLMLNGSVGLILLSLVLLLIYRRKHGLPFLRVVLFLLLLVLAITTQVRI